MCLPYSIFTIYVGVFAVFLPSYLTEDTKFTVTPNSRTVIEGSDIFIDWKYKVTNRNTEFAVISPVWNYRDKEGKDYKLGSEAIARGWQWKISSECPKRFIYPILRIQKYQSGVAGFAGLNITNVTVEDSGRYQCVLGLTSGSVPPSSMYLTVTAPTTPSAPTTTPPNATFTEASQPRNEKGFIAGQTFKQVLPFDVGSNDTWVNVTVSRNNSKVTSGKEKVIDLNKSDGVKNKYLPGRDEDIDLDVQGTSNVVNVTFTLRNLETTDTMVYMMSLVNSNHETFIQYMYLRVSDCSTRDCKNKGDSGMTNALKWGIGVGVTGTCVLIVVAGAGGRHYYKKSNSSNGQNGGNSDMALKNKVDNCKEGNDSHAQPSA